MTFVEVAFLAGLTLVMVAIVAFAATVFVSASRGGAGSFITGRMFQRAMRSSAERGESERWAFYAHRISGFAIFAFLCLHVLDVSLYAVSSRLYGQEHQIYGSGIMRLFECGLLLAILFHTFNGLRVLTLDLADLGAIWSRRLLAVSVVASIVIGLAGSIVILKPVFV